MNNRRPRTLSMNWRHSEPRFRHITSTRPKNTHNSVLDAFTNRAIVRIVFIDCLQSTNND